MTTNNLFYDKKIGLFLGDSILRGFLDVNVQLHQQLKENFDLDIIETFYKGGAKLSYLAREVFPRQIAHIINSYDNDVVVDIFLSVGAVDLSDAISDNLTFDFDDFMKKRNEALGCFLNHPYVRRVYLFPLTPRSLCTQNCRIKSVYKKYSKSDWIAFADKNVRKVNQSHFPFHPKLKMIPMPQDLHCNISDDGIHLTDLGKQMLFKSVFKNEKSFAISEDDFPILPRSSANRSPLQPIDPRIALKEKAKRDAKKEKELVNLIVSSTSCVVNGKVESFSKTSNQSSVDCSSAFHISKVRSVAATKMTNQKKQKKPGKQKNKKNDNNQSIFLRFLH